MLTRIRISLFLIFFFFLLLFNGIIFLFEASAESRRPNFDGLTYQEKGSIESACGYAYSKGAAAYNRCLRQQLAELEQAPRRPNFEGLTYQEKGSVESACGYAYSKGAAAYNRCLRQQLAELEKAPSRPNFDGLTYQEKGSIESACGYAYSKGAAAYNRCLEQQLAELEKAPRRPNFDGLTYQEKGSIESACGYAYSKGAAAYNRCLRQQLAELGIPTEENETKRPKPKRITKRPSKPSEHVSPKDIGKAQAILYELGYDAGPIDGILGKKTRIAIIEFQRDVGIPITGKVDKELLSLLTTALQIAKRPKKIEPPVQISKQSPSLHRKVPKPTMVLPSMPSVKYGKPLTAANLFRKVQSSIFVVVAGSSISELKRGENINQGSAVAVSKKCLLTNCHVLENRPYLLIIQKEDVFPARLSGIEEDLDMCVLTIEKSNLTPILAIRNFDDLTVGEKVYTVGTPVGLEQTLGEGIISGLRIYKGLKLIQTSAPISRGSSGGGLFDVSGNLIGITTFLLKDTQNLNFAIAAEQYWD